MHHNYEDILSRIKEPPLWFDEHAVPRYEPFVVGEQANIYANEVVLLAIECQACGHCFSVCVSSTLSTCLVYDSDESSQNPTLAQQIRDNTLHYGDPPNIGCCAGGPTMSSVPKQVLQYWGYDTRLPKQVLQYSGYDTRLAWVRNPELEVEVLAEWAAED